MIIERDPWPANFPDVVIHCDLGARDRHPDYPTAKAGDEEAAFRLARDLVSEDAIATLAEVARGFDPVLIPVTALEAGGFNAIPDALAGLLGAALGFQVEAGLIVQSNRVGHTRASGWHRLVTPALFDGPVNIDEWHVLVDDHVGLGGTLANLRGHIEGRRGRVLAMTTLTESRAARRIAVRAETLNMLRERHGNPLEIFWNAVFGHGLDALTEVEAAYLARQPSLDLIRARMAEAAEQASRAGLPPVDLQDGG